MSGVKADTTRSNRSATFPSTSTSDGSGNGEVDSLIRSFPDPPETALPPPEGWPLPIADPAFIGLAGEFVQMVEPESEADAAGLLVQFLVAFGNMVGRKAYFTVGAVRHHLNLFVLLVGATAKSRKGTSWGEVDRTFAKLDEQVRVLGNAPAPGDPWDKRTPSGLSSGEGLIRCVTDGTSAVKPPIPSVTDKRRLIVESEFGGTLKVLTRDGNNLSSVLRAAWDGKRVLQMLTKVVPEQATDAHVSIIGHITLDELLQGLLKGVNNTEAYNGFANRFLWCCVRRDKLLAEGGNVPDEAITGFVSRMQSAVDAAWSGRELTRDPEVREYWKAIYRELSRDRPGILGAVTARGEAQAMRLAAIYAVLDQSAVIKRQHLDAALAVWRYCERSAEYIFSQVTAERRETIWRALSLSEEGLTKTEVFKLFHKNVKKDEIDEYLRELAACGRAYCVESLSGPKGGRPEERWKATNERRNESTSAGNSADAEADRRLAA
jgi:hypothetical protein